MSVRLPCTLLGDPSIAHRAQIRWLMVSTSKNQNRGCETNYADAHRKPYRAACVHSSIMLDAIARGNLRKAIDEATRSAFGKSLQKLRRKPLRGPRDSNLK